MTVSTNDQGQQNMWAKEPRMYVDPVAAERYGYETHNEKAEKLNGRAAMIGLVFGLLSYAITGNFYFGLAWGQPVNFTNLKQWTKKQNALTVGQLCSVSSPPWEPTQPPVKSFLVSGDGIHHRCYPDCDSYRCNC